MTVSFKRLIAFVALFAITLAGIPDSTTANDGLNSERYGFHSKKQILEVARQTPANLNDNPFRDETVSASLSGASLRIDRSTVTETNIARLITAGTSDNRAIAQDKGDVTIPEGELLAPVFSNKRNFYSGLMNAGRSATNLAGDLYDAAIVEIEVIAIAERGFRDSLTAAATGYGILPIHPGNIQTTSVPVTQSRAVIRNISASMRRELPQANPLKRPETGNISIVVLQDPEPKSVANREEEIFNVGQQLLIDEYIPSCMERSDDEGKPAMALAVPTIMINYSKSAPASRLSARSVIQSAKAIVKSIIDAVRPIIGVQRALMIPQQIRNQMFRIDEIVFSSSNLKHIWNVCSTQK